MRTSALFVACCAVCCACSSSTSRAPGLQEENPNGAAGARAGESGGAGGGAVASVGGSAPSGGVGPGGSPGAGGAPRGGSGGSTGGAAAGGTPPAGGSEPVGGDGGDAGDPHAGGSSQAGYTGQAGSAGTPGGGGSGSTAVGGQPSGGQGGYPAQGGSAGSTDAGNAGQPAGGQGGAGGAGPYCPKLVFVTSQTYNGDLEVAGGVAYGPDGGDVLCASLAEAAGLGGEWTVWLSVNFDDASTRLQGDGPWCLTDRETVAFPDRSVLLTWPDVAISLTETAQPWSDFPGGDRVWTGTGLGGGSTGFTCYQWDRSAVPDYATYGLASSAGPDWTWSNTMFCDQQARLYCFQR